MSLFVGVSKFWVIVQPHLLSSFLFISFASQNICLKGNIRPPLLFRVDGESMAVTMESVLCDTHTQLKERVKLVSWRTVSVVYSRNTPYGLTCFESALLTCWLRSGRPIRGESE